MTVEQWDTFEVELRGPSSGNPFTEVKVSAVFRNEHREVAVDGFYDGDGVYRIRFMPDETGDWTYETRSNRAELRGKTGGFPCGPATGNNRGPVRIAKQYHFQYEDGTPHWSFGTTCYAWTHQGDALEEQTLSTLKTAPFNKVRMCVFPKHYAFNENEPEYHPFEGTLETRWDFTRFHPPFWRHLDRRVGDLRRLGIEADLILFHPYDRWGYAKMDAESDDRYLRYVVARLAPYRNVWWSFANEWDLIREKSEGDWDRFFRIVQTKDPYQHLRSIHNCRRFYDHGKPWVTHCSIQRPEPAQSLEWRQQYGKPVVDDECQYEGNIAQRWGNNTPQDETRKFWDGIVNGGYVGHGETYLHPDDVLWWSKGGVLHGQSPARIAFLRKIVEEGPHGLLPHEIGRNLPSAFIPGEYYLAYVGSGQSAVKPVRLPEDRDFRIDVIDTWEMTITAVEGTYRGACEVKLPGKPYMALRIRRVGR